MASWESRFWLVRRWLADRLVGDHGYAKNVATTYDLSWIGEPWTGEQRIAGPHYSFGGADAAPVSITRSPQETA